MKLAILSDVHANLPALQTVAEHIGRWRPDQVVVAGDLINRGPRPAECLALAEQQVNWEFLLGNHEESVLEQSRPDAPRSGPAAELRQLFDWTLRQIDGAAGLLEQMRPFCEFDGPDGRPVRICHASLLPDRKGIWPDSDLDEVRRRIAPAPALFGTAHTHVPLVRPVDDTLVVNSGSVGAPCDGDPRAGYAQIEFVGGGWKARIVRLSFDREQAARDLHDADFLAGQGPLGQLILMEREQSHSFIPAWRRQYKAAILAGEISLAETVERFLGDLR